jgi:hypothetical protein
MQSDQPSRLILLQRIRNQIIEYLEMASSFDNQRRYQDSVPHVSVPVEVIELWLDWIDENEPLKNCLEPVFSPEERDAVVKYHALFVDVCNKTPKMLPALDVLIRDPNWMRLRAGAEQALIAFRKRGKLAEDEETF